MATPTRTDAALMTRLASNRYWSEREGRAALAAWRASGSSMAAFARAHGLEPRRLGWWNRQLGAERGPARLLPVKLVERAAPAQLSNLTPPARSSGAMEVALANGRRVRVDARFDEAALLRLVRALEELPPC